MRPDGPERRTGKRGLKASAPRSADIVQHDGGVADAELARLVEELSRAGAAARAAVSGVAWDPTPAFAAELRARLTAPVSLALAPVALPLAPMASAATPLPLAAPLARHAQTIMPAPRWTALAAAAVLLLSVIGFNATLQRPGPPEARASVASGASLLRDGQGSALEAGTALRVGDEIRVGPGGGATIQIGSSEARLAAGADVRIDVVSVDRIILDQIDGRVYHRVATGPGVTYTVETASLDWMARGTAFDVDRDSADLDARITVTTIQHEIRVSGPAIAQTIGEGARAVAMLAHGEPTITIGRVPEHAFRDPWLVANARLDRALGHPLGVLDRLDGVTVTPGMTADASQPALPSAPPGQASAAPGPTPTPTPSATVAVVTTPAPPRAAASARPTARPTPRPTPTATPRTTPRPTPTPTPTPKPTPKPTPGLASLSFTATACAGGVVLDWGAFTGGDFGHYLVLRSTSASIPPAYPPGEGVAGVAGTFTTDQDTTSGSDRTRDGGGKVRYRAVAFAEDGHALAASPVRTVTRKPIKHLGRLEIEGDGASTSFDWTGYAGPAGCFSHYKLAYSTKDSTPSYLEGAPIAWVGSEQTTSSASVGDLEPGTYWFRMQVIRTTALGKFVVAQTDVRKFTVK